MNRAPKTGLLLINLGTPSSPDLPDVQRYLRKLLMDERMLEMPAWRRFLLVQLVIVPGRSRRSAASYQKIWTDRGSPLLVHGQDLRDLVETQLGDGVAVELGMRFGEPSIRSALDRLEARSIDRLVLFPLYAQSSSASTGSSVEAVQTELARRGSRLDLEVVPAFYAHPAYLEAKRRLAVPVLEELDPDLVLFSFHGVPERQLTGSGPACLEEPDCCSADAARLGCYRAQCLASARAQAEQLGLVGDQYAVSFQSRLGRTPWITPFTDEVLAEQAERGRRRVVVISGFVADCLETLEEIRIRGRELWFQNGGEAFELVPAPNSSAAWAKALVEIAGAHLLGTEGRS
ncbi:MAG: ferrochelatase [Myxococcales bacterium]|nr:ferrochelatase [Myxococcales bacterium]